MVSSPGGFVSVDVALDLGGTMAEGRRERSKRDDLASAVERVPASCQRLAELRVARDCGVPDAVDCLDAVYESDRVQTTPRAASEDAGVELQVQVSVRVASAARCSAV